MSGALLERWNQGFVSSLERPALAWLVARLPGSITPDILTGIGILGAVITFIGYTLAAYNLQWVWLASFGLAVNWFGDSLDGTLARYRGIERPRYGYYLDNSVDCIAQLLLALGIGLSGIIRFDLCFLALTVYLMTSVLTFIRANISTVFQITYAGVGPTEMRVGFVFLNLLVLAFPPQSIGPLVFGLKYPDLISLAWSIAALTTFLICMIRQVRQLALEEPPVARAAGFDAQEARLAELPPESMDSHLVQAESPVKMSQRATPARFVTVHAFTDKNSGLRPRIESAE